MVLLILGPAVKAPAADAAGREKKSRLGGWARPCCGWLLFSGELTEG
jgi:hypothetical protein